MLASRGTDVAVSGSLSALSDHELRIAIASEVMGWKNVHCDARGRITGSCDISTIVPPVAPDWLGNEYAMKTLERVIASCGWSSIFRIALADIAGDFNPNPTLRQRAEAALLAARESRKTMLD